MRKFTKLTSIIVVIAYALALFSVYATVSASEAETTAFTSDMIIECEQTILSANAEIVKERKASDKKYVSFTGAKIDDPKSAETADMTVKIKIPSAGNYSVFAKVYTNGGTASQGLAFACYCML